MAQVSRLEGDFLLAVCTGNKDDVRASLRELIQQCAQAGDHRLARSWCTALLNRSSVGARTTWPLLAKDISALGLDGRELIKTVVLPVLGHSGWTEELRADLDQACRRRPGRNCPLKLSQETDGCEVSKGSMAADAREYPMGPS